MKNLLTAVLLTLALTACSDTERSGGTVILAPVLSNPYDAGPLLVQEIAVAAGEQGAPRRGLLFAPSEGGPWPLVQFQHGFSSSVDSYQFMLTRLASHGFVVFAPQMYEGGNPADAPGIPDEVAAAVAVSDWLKAKVASLLGTGVNTAAFGLAGHSRGGQVAWRMLAEAGVRATALSGVDPVDGNAPPFSSDTGPLITANPLRFGFAVQVQGTGLGRQGEAFACAPAVRNYEKFIAAGQDRVYGVVATEHGHADMTDTDCVTCRAACVSNPSPGMPEFTAGQLVAYYSLRLKSDAAAARFLSEVSAAPVPATASVKN